MKNPWLIFIEPGSSERSRMLAATTEARLRFAGCMVAMPEFSTLRATEDSETFIITRELTENLKVNNEKNKPWYRQGLKGY